MSTDTRTRLVAEFSSDHRQMTRDLARLLELLRRGDLAAAQQLADRIDVEAGPHIQFEESVLYPQVGEVEGQAFEEKLLAEHDVAQQGLRRLASLKEDEMRDANVQAELVDAFATAERHAESCGTLISHLESLSESRQRIALSHLESLRDAGRRWTELPR